jgi:hypothetical protein
MDLIRVLRDTLDPLIERTPFAPSETESIIAGGGEGIDLLEYSGVQSDGRIVLFGFYHFSAQRTITAMMWTPADPTPGPPGVSRRSVVTYHEEWDYGPAIDLDDLVLAIVTEVATRLRRFAPAGEPDSATSCKD